MLGLRRTNIVESMWASYNRDFADPVSKIVKDLKESCLEVPLNDGRTIDQKVDGLVKIIPKIIADSHKEPVI